MNARAPLLSYSEALDLLGQLDVRSAVKSLPLDAAAGRVLASEVRMDRDQPGFDRATMDGYALCLDGDAARFEVIGTVTAGERFEGLLEPGQAVRIMTGAPCPENVTVVPIELTDAGSETVLVQDPAALTPGRNIAWRGEDAHEGDVILRAGTRLEAASLSAAAMAGAEQLECFTPPRVGVVTTGDEVGKSGPAGIRDSNGPLLSAFLWAAGSPVTRVHARDDEAQLEETLARAAQENDVIVSVGGVSMGSKDFVPACAGRLGFEKVLHKVAIQPGKPVFIARHAGGKLFLGLPGNPVSVLATAHLFLLPALGLFQGGWRPAWQELPCASDYEHRGRRHLFLPGRLEAGGVQPVRWNGSGDLLAAASADGLIELPVGTRLRAGDALRFLPYLAHEVGACVVLPPRGGVRGLA